MCQGRLDTNPKNPRQAPLSWGQRKALPPLSLTTTQQAAGFYLIIRWDTNQRNHLVNRDDAIRLTQVRHRLQPLESGAANNHKISLRRLGGAQLHLELSYEVPHKNTARTVWQATVPPSEQSISRVVILNFLLRQSG